MNENSLVSIDVFMTSLSSSIEQNTVNLVPSRHGKGLQFKMFFQVFSNLNTLFHRQNSSLILQYDSRCTRASRVVLVDTSGITYQDNLIPKVSSSLSVSLVPRDMKRRKPGNELVPVDTEEGSYRNKTLRNEPLYRGPNTSDRKSAKYL